jgi:hypothetical protein
MSSLLQCFEFLVSQLQVKTQVTTLQTTQVEQIHYELGDHADDAIAAESAKRRVTVPFDEVFDDCGDDTTAIDLPEADAETAHFVHAYSDASSEPCSSDDAASAFDSVFFISQFWGSDDCYAERAESSGLCEDMQGFYSAWQTSSKQVDVLEIFGGEGHTVRLALRQGLSSGGNYDLESNCDLSRKEDVEHLLRFIHSSCPRVIIMAPPCTAFGSWANYNWFHAHEDMSTFSLPAQS